MENTLICICGPTASGKTALSIALAQQRNTEIISCDSMQLYQGMDIGTAKPTTEQRCAARHHMIDVCAPGEAFSVARYVTLADEIAQRLLAQGKIPLVVGGTGLYADALIAGNAFAGGERDLAVREKYREMARAQGNQAVHDCLAQVDPESAAALHPNNLGRVIRALEVYWCTGMTIGEFNRTNQRSAPRYRAIKIGLCPSSRERLYARIDERVDEMIACGLQREVRHLWESGQLVGTAAQAIGYKEWIDCFTGHRSEQECVALIKQRSRNYAKRQMTWFRRDHSIHWMIWDFVKEKSQVLQETTKYLQNLGV